MRVAQLVALLVLMTSGPAAAQDDAAHVLERGKYTEQSLGDLEAAMALYRQIVADAEANRRHVAEARLRLGLCLKQLGRVEEGNAELRAVTEQFADLTDLAAEAREAAESHAAALQLDPAPWEDGEILRLDMKMMSGFGIGSIFTSAEATTAGGRPIWRFGVRRCVTMANNEGISRVDVDRRTFAPLSSIARAQDPAGRHAHAGGHIAGLTHPR
jgi:tetratricopeptide (TPR) repeat protein